MLAIEARESRNAVSAALLMHGLLAAALLLSLQWKDRTPIVQAELWSAMPRDIPATFTPPAPAVRPAPPAPAAPVPETKADIALKKKEEPKKTESKKEEPKKLEPPKADVAKAQQEAQKKAQEKKLAEKNQTLKFEWLSEERILFTASTHELQQFVTKFADDTLAFSTRQTSYRKIN